MEDDDEFGDLYTDVLQPLTATTTSQPPVKSTPPAPGGPIDLNNSIPSDDEEILYGGPSSNQLKLSQPDLNLNNEGGNSAKMEEYCVDEAAAAAAGGEEGARVSGSGSGVVKVEEKGLQEDRNFVDDSKEGLFQVKEEALGGNFGIEDTGEQEEPVIPGLSTSVPRVLDQGGEEGEGGDEWDDSDSEDDLQIVLNDNNVGGMMGMEGVGDEDDEDGDNLVIVADTDDPNHQHQTMEEMQDWGEDASQAAEGGGERKDILGGDAGKLNGIGGAVVAPKIGYSSHGYHPFHSQFKYVRPGAAPMPGAAPVSTGGAPGQVRPPASMLPFAGRGRGDWRPTGIKNAPPMPKNFHPGFGTSGWGSSGGGRGFGSGMDFTLPSHKTIFEFDIDGFEEKPWRLQGIDISDFFNFGLNEESWKAYCKQLEQLRLEATMQSKIRVYESGRTEQEYDPDLPPELAAAAGIHDISSENQNVGKTDVHNDLSKGSVRGRMQLPAGRAIQVETGMGERLPSIDTRAPRIRDSDAIIEIVLQGSADDESIPENDIAVPPDDEPSKEDLRERHEIEEDNASEDNHFDIPQGYSGRKREHIGRKSPFMGSVHEETTVGDRASPFPSETQVEDHPDSRGKTSAYPRKKLSSPHHERQTKRRAPDRSPLMTHSGSLQDKKFGDDQKEESTESVGRKQSPPPSPSTLGSAEDQDSVQNDIICDEAAVAEGGSEMEREEIALDATAVDTFKDEKPMHTTKNQKLVSRTEQHSVEKVDDRDDSKAARSSENSKARSGSSRDQRNMRDSVGEEVVQAGGSVRSGRSKRALGEDERPVRNRGRDERKESERNRMAMKGMEDPYSRKKWDSNLAYHSHVKPENFDKRKGREAEGVWQDEDPHVGRTRAEDMRKRDRGDEMVSRHRHKVRDERVDKEEHRSRKVSENGSWKGDHDRDMVPQQDRDDILKARHNSMDGINSKRRKEEAHGRRADLAEREEALHVHRESSTRRKRERDDNLDQRNRDEQARLRDEDQHSFRYKEESWSQRERVERQREREEWKEREEVRGGVRNGRAVEDKAWVGHSRLKEDHRSVDREYQFKETVREQPSRRDRVENETLSRHRIRDDAYARGNKLNNDERRSRQERGSTGIDRIVSATDAHRVQEKKHKDSVRKSRETDGASHNSLVPSKRNRDDHNNQRSERVNSRGMLEQGSSEQNPVARQSSKKHKEDASSEDELQDSKRGRSKLERWTSHKERDFSVGTKSLAAVNVKEIDKYNDNGASLTSKLPDGFSKPEETVENANSKSLAEVDGSILQMKNDDVKLVEGKHLDTVEKLKKRSERFKLPMPSEKEALAIKKIENEPLPSIQAETRTDSDVKPERPARKRRWTSG